MSPVISPKITLKILPVLHGDAICVQFVGNDGKYHNIFVDGGFARTYSRTLKKEAERVIRDQEKIDLFIVTHTDQDHISGVLKFVRDYGEADMVSQYWFNYSPLDAVLNTASNKISIADGIKLRDYLKQRGKLPEHETTDDIRDVDCYGAKLTVLSPSKSVLEKYQELWQSTEQEQTREGLISSRGNDYAHSIGHLLKNSFREDKKLENRVSIAFLLELHDMSFLFLADSQPSTIVRALRSKGYSIENKLKVDYVKLSHHASKSNTSDELLSIIDCHKFMISANGKNRYFFPHKQALARVLAHAERDLSEHITFIFNYNNKVLQNIFTEEEKLTYNFSCLYPNENQNGFTIEL